MNNNNLNIKPILSYNNILVNKNNIYNDNRNKCGIYRWNNLVTGFSYIGSSIKLDKRLGNYFSINFLKKELSKNNSKISNSLLKYGYSNFSLDILEHCDRYKLIEREQYYIDTCNCEYNILKTAYSRFGFKASSSTLEKFKTRKLSSEALENLRRVKKGYIPPYSALRTKNHLLAVAHTTTIFNIKTNSTKTYNSISAAAKDINVNSKTLLYNIKHNKLLKGIYQVTRTKK